MEKKKILFIGVGFHEYDNHIIDHLKIKYEVWYLWSSEFVQKHPYIHYMSSKLPRIIPNCSSNSITRYIENTKDCNFDIIFVIKGSNLREEHLILLKEYHPHAVYKLYLWDEWRIMKNGEMLKRYFPTIYSFDSEDCKKYGFILRPLFYLDNSKIENKKYDISFIGGEHSGRLETIMRIKKSCIENGLSFYFLISTRFNFIIKLIFKSFHLYRRCNGMLKRGGIPYNEFLKITRNSKTVLDIHYYRQSGITMRTLEALATGAKVITTNEHIREYKNIPSNMYYIWNMKEVDEIVRFIKEPADVFKIDDYYSVDTFINDILN